jgi:Ca2+-binding EF-hand superfamily protein
LAKKNEYIRTEEIGEAFRHSGQNPSEDVIKDMIDKAKKLKESYNQDLDEGLYAHKQ